MSSLICESASDLRFMQNYITLKLNGDGVMAADVVRCTGFRPLGFRTAAHKAVCKIARELDASVSRTTNVFMCAVVGYHHHPSYAGDEYSA